MKPEHFSKICVTYKTAKRLGRKEKDFSAQRYYIYSWQEPIGEAEGHVLIIKFQLFVSGVYVVRNIAPYRLKTVLISEICV